MADAVQHSFPSNIQIHNFDVSVLFIQTRAWANKLYTKLVTGGDSQQTYVTSLEFIKQLYDCVKYNIKKLNNVKDWDRHEKICDDFFKSLINNPKPDPKQLIMIWDILREDIESSGIYSEGENEKIKIIRSLLGGN